MNIGYLVEFYVLLNEVTNFLPVSQLNSQDIEDFEIGLYEKVNEWCQDIL